MLARAGYWILPIHLLPPAVTSRIFGLFPFPCEATRPKSTFCKTNLPAMPVPVILATAAATGSIITSIKSGWELRRMIKKKQEQLEAAEEAPYIFRKLRRAHEKGLLNDAEYDHWYEKFLVAKVERDCKS